MSDTGFENKYYTFTRPTLFLTCCSTLADHSCLSQRQVPRHFRPVKEGDVGLACRNANAKTETTSGVSQKAGYSQASLPLWKFKVEV